MTVLSCSRWNVGDAGVRGGVDAVGAPPRGGYSGR